MSFPLVVRAIRISLENVDHGLEDAARTLGAGPLDRFASITLPLIAPGILAGAVTAFAAGLGEFGAVITFASNIPGETRTLPLALYTALQTPDGDMLAARLAIISLSLGLAGLLVSELLSRAIGRRLGRGPGALMLRVELRKRRGDFTLETRTSARPRQASRPSFGRSGCGKSTLISLIAGLLTPDSGRVVVGGRCLVRQRTPPVSGRAPPAHGRGVPGCTPVSAPQRALEPEYGLRRLPKTADGR